MAWNVFKFLYSSSYTILFVLTGVLLLLTPADAIHQALKNGSIYNIFIISGFYLLTAVLSLFLYFYRLYYFRSVIGDIPKYYLPVKKGDLSNRGYRVVKAELARSAIVAWESRPRGIPLAPTGVTPAVTPNGLHKASALEHVQFHHRGGKSSQHAKASAGSGIFAELVRVNTSGSTAGPLPWGDISHLDHSPPISDAFSASTMIPPDTHYPSVIETLPTILSTRAALVHPALSLPRHGKSMRSYLFDILVDVGLVESVLAEAFINAYEAARFRDGEISSDEFLQIMKVMAAMLRGIEAVQAGTSHNGVGGGAGGAPSSSHTAVPPTTARSDDLIGTIGSSHGSGKKGFQQLWFQGLGISSRDPGSEGLQRMNTQTSTASYLTTTDTMTTVSTNVTTRRRGVRRQTSLSSSASSDRQGVS